VPILASFYRLPWYRRLVWGQPANVATRPFGSTVRVGPCTLRAIPTPGHAADHVCLWETEHRWLFSGDLFIHTRVTHVRRSEDVGTILASLRSVAKLEPKLVICSHAGFVEDARSALDQRIAYWEELAQRAASMAGGGASPRAIRRRLLGGEGAMMVLSGGDFSKTNLIRSLLDAARGGDHALV
jgi:glyoxylase-like metal-dependent hydrolase (beta-lactamase superfamily II)